MPVRQTPPPLAPPPPLLPARTADSTSQLASMLLSEDSQKPMTAEVAAQYVRRTVRLVCSTVPSRAR